MNIFYRFCKLYKRQSNYLFHGRKIFLKLFFGVILLISFFLSNKILNSRIRVLNIVAHPNDSLLFMMPDIYSYLKKNFQVTTIFLTSGDAGQKVNYWKNREKGIMAVYSNMVNEKNIWEEEKLKIDNIIISVFYLKNDRKVKLIFLRLPDGSFNGEGYKNNNFQSLKKLWFKDINQIKTIDNANSYSLSELINIIRFLIEKEKPKIINILDYSNYKYTGDHSDHYISSYLTIESIKKTKNNFRIYSYLSNYSLSKNPNLTKKETEVKSKLITLYLKYDILAKKGFNLYSVHLNRQYKSKLNLKSKKLPPLYVGENKLLNENNHSPVILKGVSTQFFGYHYYDFETFKKIYNIFKEKDINLIGVFVNLEDTPKKINYLDWLINQTEKDNIYVYLTPTIDGNIKNPLIYVKGFPDFMCYLSKRYKNKYHILYGVWSEPHFIEWNQYLKLVEESIIKIRKYQPKAAVLITGIDWGSNFKNINDLKRFKNIILNFHYYPASDARDLNNYLNLNPEIIFPWENFINDFPIIVGEFGGVWKKDFSSNEDLYYISLALENINKYQLSYTFYTIDHYSSETEKGLSLIDHKNLSISKKGNLLIEDIKKFPPSKL